MAFFVNQRVREIGIRMALGSRREQIVRLVVRQSMRLTLIGIGVGLIAAFLTTRFLSSLLYGVSATAPGVFVGISVLLAGVALVATFVPARRASKLEPFQILRS